MVHVKETRMNTGAVSEVGPVIDILDTDYSVMYTQRAQGTGGDSQENDVLT